MLLYPWVWGARGRADDRPGHKPAFGFRVLAGDT